MSLEQLRDVVVTTASRGEERLSRVAASTYVVTANDIRRSGATSIPEALRLAPMLNIAQADGNQYAITARGFNNVLANKMLVLIDGRTVYTPLFSGVFWESQDVMLENVERIEVIAGPNTALWGSNAVNGLIHIITRRAGETQGAALSVDAAQDRRSGAFRWGGRAGEQGHFRAYAKSQARDATRRADGASVNDAAHGAQAGFRADWESRRDRVTLQGDLYEGEIDQAPAPRHVSGGNLMARWERSYADGAQASLQAYADQTRRDHPQTFAEQLGTLDVVGQYSFVPTPRQRVVLGGGYRHSHDRVSHEAAFGFFPATRSLEWSRVFAQDQVDLTPALALTLAASAERNPYTGTELLPSIRLAWEAPGGSVAWGALSRAARAPSRIDREYYLPAQPPYLLAGGPNFQSELSDVAELGLRSQSTPALAHSVTAFHHRHRRLRSVTPTAQGLVFENNIEGSTRGVEAWARWQPLANWRLDAGGVLQKQQLRVRGGAVDAGGMAALGNDPRRHASLRSSLDLGGACSWDVAVRHVGALPNPAVPAYTAVDTRFAWRPTPRAEVALGVRNLTDSGHAEWGAAANRVAFERSAYLQWRVRL